MSLNQRLTERIGIHGMSFVQGNTGTSTGQSAYQATNGTVSIDTERNVAFIVQGFGTGTFGATIQQGVVTSGTYGGTDSNQFGSTSGGLATWSNVVVGTVTATANATRGQIKVLEVSASDVQDAKYLRVVSNNKTENTYGSVLVVSDYSRYLPNTNDDSVSVEVI